MGDRLIDILLESCSRRSEVPAARGVTGENPGVRVVDLEN